MIDIKIDLQLDQWNALKLALSSEGLLSALASGVAANARDQWMQISGERLQTSRRAYQNAIQAVQSSGPIATVSLLGAFPNMIEQGATPFDMRLTLLNGQSARVIPFRHRGPDSLGVTGVGAPVGSAYKEALGKEGAKKLGRRVWRAARQLKPGQELPPGIAPVLRPGIHSTDLYAGMNRFPGTHKSNPKYLTFRTISIDSDQSKWQYPGLEARHFVDDVMERLPDIANKIVTELLAGFTGP